MSQRARLDALDKFKSGYIPMMLATGERPLSNGLIAVCLEAALEKNLSSAVGGKDA